MEFHFDDYQNRADCDMDDGSDTRLDQDLDPGLEQIASQDLIPSIERTPSVMEQSQDPVDNRSASSPVPKLESEDEDAMDIGPDHHPNAGRQQSSYAVCSAVDERAGAPDATRTQSIPSTASPGGLPKSSTASSLTPMLATASIFGGLVIPSQLPAISSPTASVFGLPNNTLNPSMLGGPVRRSSPYKSIQPESQVVDDDDDDIMIIEPEDASHAARQKWNLPTPQSTQNDDVVLFKTENRDDAPRIPSNPSTPPPALTPPPLPFQMPTPPRRNIDPARTARILAAQRVMLQRNKVQNAQNAQNSGEGSSRRHSGAEPLARTFDGPEDVPFGTSDQIDSAMGGTYDDNSWMDEDVGVDEEYEDWVKLKTHLSRKQRSGTITGNESMALYKVTQSINTRDRLRAAASRGADEEDEDPDSLFLPETREETIKRHRANQPRREETEDAESNSGSNSRDDAGDGEYNDDHAMAAMMGGEDNPEAEPDLGLTKSGKPRKRRAKVVKGPREYLQREEEKQREKERSNARKKRGRQLAIAASSSRRKVKSPVTVKGKGKAKGKGKEKEKPSKKGRAKGKEKEVVTNGQSLLASGNLRTFGNDDSVAHMILEDLMNNDPIAERLQNPIFNRPAEEEIVGSQSKTTQFQRLFANIPEPEDALARGAVRSDKAKLRDASKSFGYAKCKAKDGKWLIKGMKSPLYHHQLLGAQWMVQRELSSQPPHGGLLADSMGLGKTVQTLACMVGNPPGPEDVARRVKSTLIIGPAPIVKQWIEEIGNHVNSDVVFPKILHYQTSSKISPSILEDTDIVVTSYNTVMKQFPFPDNEGRMEIARNGYPAWRKGAVENMGALHQVNWYRVVLDEAQAIKNNSARTSLACQNLKSVYRWCLTGTPLLNKLEELFPYLRFLKANYSMDWSTFQKYFCDPTANICYSRIATLLSYTMMRRTMKTSILNRPIITLPKPHPNIQYVQFSQEETIIYRITENRFRNNLNAFFRRGDASRNYGVFMVQLLRLRQCTSHPFMLERTIKESWTMEDVQELRKRLGRLRVDAKPFYEQCKTWVETSQTQHAEALARGEEIPEGQMLPFGQSSYGRTFDMDRALKTLNETELYNRVTCSLCSDVPNKPMKTDCGHIFCNDCIETFVAQLVSQDSDYFTCPECNRVFTHMEKVHGYLDPESRSLSRRSKSKTKGKAKGKERESSDEQAENIHTISKGRDLLGFEPMAGDSTWVTKSDNDELFPLTPSTKTTALKALLLKGFDDAPMDKVVIYVQFRTLARIVGRICSGEGWGFLYLTGDSSQEHREKAIKRFRSDDDAKILVAGLKCGGLGLNFPWANRCISLDLWWNHAVEQQAFGRIFRIGQDKEMYMTRIVVRNTVDMRMLGMQLHKLQSLEKAMRGDPKERQALSLKQLANLFGFLRTDGDGEILSVEADYEDEDGEDQGVDGARGRDRNRFSGGAGPSRGYGGGSQDGGDSDAGNFIGADTGNRQTRGGDNWGRGMSAEADGQQLGWDNVGVEGYNRERGGEQSQGYMDDVMEVEDPIEDI